MRIHTGNHTLDLDIPVVMAIVNVTPDSFYAGSRTFEGDAIARRVEQALAEGAAVLDVGGYSSRPGAEEVTPAEEYARVARGFEAVRQVSAEIPVSVDTFRAEVVQRLFDRFGPFIINDISGGEFDPAMIETAARCGVPFIAMHMRGTPATMQQYTDYEDIVDELDAFFEKKLLRLRRAGVEQVILDPGFGFAKNTEQNYILLGKLGCFRRFGVPLLAGISRKSMIYKVLGCKPEEALAGTCALHWEALRGGASILRAHDVRAAADVIRLHHFYTQNRCDGHFSE